MATVSDGMSLDEKLAELDRNYPVLYDKSSPYFKNKQMKNAAWKEIAASLGLETAAEASTLFKNLRNRYSRDKRKIKVKKVSGTGSEEVKEAEKQSSELFNYLRWLDPYIQLRQTTSNLLANSTDQDHEESDTRNDSHGSDTQYSDDLRGPSPVSDTSATNSTNSLKRDGSSISETTGRIKYCKKKKANKNKKVDEAELELIKSISSKFQNKSSECMKEKDDDDMFCALLASQLRQLNPRDKLLVKMQVNNIIYNHLMKPVESIPSSQGQGNLYYAESSTISSPHQPLRKSGCENSTSDAVLQGFYQAPNDLSGNSQFHNLSTPNRDNETRQYFAPGHFFHNR